MLAKRWVVFPDLELLGHVAAVLLGIIAVVAFTALQLDDPAYVLVFGHDLALRNTPGAENQPVSQYRKSRNLGNDLVRFQRQRR